MSVFNIAWAKAMTPENIKAGFKRTGIWPPNPNEVPPELFALAGKSESKSVDKLILFLIGEAHPDLTQRWTHHCI